MARGCGSSAALGVPTAAPSLTHVCRAPAYSAIVGEVDTDADASIAWDAVRGEALRPIVQSAQ